MDYRMLARAALGALASLLLCGAAAAADPAATIEKGLAWLVLQPQAEGAVTGEAGAIATPFQVRSETLVTLKKLSTAPAPTGLVNAVSQETEDSVEYLSRKIAAVAPLGSDVSTAVAKLLSWQRADGGFGATIEYESNALDTAYALLALKAAASTDTAAIGRAIAYLTSTQASDGSFGINEQSSAYITAYALQALNAFSQTNPLTLAIAKAKTWLVVPPTGVTYGVLENAVVTLAIAGATSDTTAFSNLQAALVAAQEAAGSWGSGDPYLTAVVLRALVARGTAQPPATTGQVQGKVIDAAGAAIAGASAIATGPTSVTVTSDASGFFGLANLSPGTYAIQVGKSGLTTVSQTVTVSAGVTNDLGLIRLLTANGDAALQGIVRDGTSGQPLAGAIVAVSGKPDALTDAGGGYAVTAITPGTVTITISKTGYQSLQATANLAPSSVLIFSPNLYPPGQTTATATGRVVDKATAAGIVGATVKVGTATATSGAGGAFELPGLATGSAQFDVSAAGYKARTLTGTLAAGANDVGVIELEKLAAAKITGKVSDKATNIPIGGATVTLTQQGASPLTAVTNTNGLYEIAGVTQTQFSLGATAAGYQSRSLAITLNSLADAAIDVTLDKVQNATASLKSVTTDRSAYDPNSAIEIEAEVTNLTSQPLPMRFNATILDSAANPVLEIPALSTMLPVSVAPVEVELETHLTVQPPGTYSVVVRGFDASGQLLVEGSTSFVLNDVTRVAANVNLDPPIAQAGFNQPVKITASLFNQGNRQVPAGTVELSIRLDVPDTNVVPGASTTFAKLVDSPTASALAAAVYGGNGKLYLLDGPTTTRRLIEFTPDAANPDTGVVRTLTLPSQFSYFANSLGVDGTYAYLLTTVNSIAKVRLSDGGLEGSAIPTGLNSTLAFVRNPANNRFYTSGIEPTKPGNRIFDMGADGSGRQEVIGPGISDPSGMARATDGTLFISNGTANSISSIDASGKITPYVTAGLSRPRGLAIGPDGYLYVANEIGNSISRISTTNAADITTYASGTANFSAPKAIAFSGSVLYVANSGNGTVVKVPSQGTVQPFAKSLASIPRGMAYDGQSNLYITTGTQSDGAVIKLGPNDVTTPLFGTLNTPRYVAVSTAGDVYVVHLTTVLKNTAANTHASGLSSPKAIALGPDAKLYIAESGLERVSVVNSSPTVDTFVDSVLADGKDIRVALNGDRYVLNAGYLAKLPVSGPPRVVNRWTYTAKALALAPDPSTGGYYTQDSTTVRKYRPDHTLERTTGMGAFLAEGIALGPTGQVLVAEQSSGKIRQIDASGVVSDYFAMGAGVSAIVGDGSGGLYVLMSGTNLIKRLTETNGVKSATSIVTTTAGAKRVAVNPAANTLYVSWDGGIGTNGGVVSHVGGGAASSVVTNRRNLAALEYVGGAVQVVDTSTKELVSYSASAVNVVQDAIAGFTTPSGIAWNGTQLLISDSGRIVAADASGYARLFANASLGDQIAITGGRVVGASTTPALVGKLVGYSLDPSKTPAQRTLETLYDMTNTTVTGVAVRPSDGAIALSATGEARVDVVNVASTPPSVIAGYAGLISPSALAVDGAGNVFVSAVNSGQKLLRIDSTGKRATVFSPVSAAALAFDSTGSLYTAEPSSEIYRYDSSGNKAFVAKSDTSGDNASFFLTGLAVAASDLYATDAQQLMVRRKQASGTLMEPFASGILDPRVLRLASDGSLYVGNRTSGNVLKVQGGRISAVATGLGNLTDLAVASSGRIFASNSLAEVVAIETNGLQLQALNYISQGGAIGSYALAIGPGDALVGAGFAKAFRNTLTFTPGYPAAGSIVETRTQPVGGIAVGTDSASTDFGTWVPPYAGEYTLTLRHLTVAGGGQNQLHVGPAATGKITPAKASLPPGDSPVTVAVKVTGGDQASVVKFDTSQLSFVAKSSTGIDTAGAMGADAAGNIYFAVIEPNSVPQYFTVIRRISPSGAIEEMWREPSRTQQRGVLPVDSQGYLYFVSGNGLDNPDIRRIKLDPVPTSSELFKPIGAGVLSLAMDSTERIVALTLNTLYRIGKDANRALETIAGSLTATGIAHSITMDAADNIYVHFGVNPGTANDSLVKFAPNGTRSTLVNVGAQPRFEFEGINIAGDCANNLLMTPYFWDAVGQVSSNEEYTIVQWSGSTNRVAQIIDGRKINNDLTDIDAIVYDRLGQSLLMWTDRVEGRIYRVPMKCGAIQTDLHLVFPGAQAVSGFTVAPQEIPRTDGMKEYAWSLKDVTTAGQTLNFDTTLAGLKLGDVRAVASQAFLTFRNPFSTGVFTQPIDVPTVGVDGMVDVSIGVNGTSFPANTNVVGTTTLANRDTLSARGGNLEVKVLDGQGAVVATVTQQAVSVPPGATLPITSTFNTASFIVGSYRMVATLTDSATGMVIMTSTAGFDIVADATKLVTSVSTDKQTYLAVDTATISARVRNVSVNAIVSGLKLTLVVRDPTGATILNETRDVGTVLAGQASFPPGALQDAFFRIPLAGRPAGTYTATLTVNDASVAPRTAQFIVGSTADTGSGLRGALTATRTVNQGETVTISGSVTNSGNAAIAGATLIVRVIRVSTALEERNWTSTVSLAVNETKPISQPWSTTGVAGGDYIVAASVTVNGRETLLGQAPVTIVNPTDTTPDNFSFAAKTNVELKTLVTSEEITVTGINVSVPISITGGEYSVNGAAYTSAASTVKNGDKVTVRVMSAAAFAMAVTATLKVSEISANFTATTKTAANVRVDRGFDREARVLVLAACKLNWGENAPDDGACVEQRRAFMSQYLTALGIANKVVTTTDAFKLEFRAGTYNVYWISGGASKLLGTLAEEVREAAYRGDSVIVDGQHDDRNVVLDEVMGVAYRGRIVGATSVTVSGAGLPAGTFSMSGAPAGRYDLASATKQGALNTGEAAVATNAFGYGKGLLFAFDLVGTLHSQPNSALLKELVAKSIDLVLPLLPAPFSGGAYAPIVLTLTNTEPVSVDVEVKATLPAGFTLATGAPPAVVSGSEVKWTLTLAAGESRTFDWAVRTAETSSNYSIPISVTQRYGTTSVDLGVYPLSVLVRALDTSLPAAITDLQALALTLEEKVARDRAVKSLQDAQLLIGQKKYEEALVPMIDALATLDMVKSISTALNQYAIANALQEVGRRWYFALPACPATPLCR